MLSYCSDITHGSAIEKCAIEGTGTPKQTPNHEITYKSLDLHGEYRLGDWIQTYTGRQFWPLDAHPDEIDIIDIAHALSNQCRYSGHTSSFYSVAQHSVLVSYAVPQQHAIWGLLHDASEAYLVDLPRPLKRGSKMGALYMEIEHRLMGVICQRFGLSPDCPPEVKEADNMLLRAEKRDLMRSGLPWYEESADAPIWEFEIEPWTPHRAEAAFLRRYERLTTGRAA